MKKILLTIALVLISSCTSNDVRNNMKYEKYNNIVQEYDEYFYWNTYLIYQNEDYNYICKLSEYKGRIKSIKKYKDIEPTREDFLNIEPFKDDIYSVIKKCGFPNYDSNKDIYGEYYYVLSYECEGRIQVHFTCNEYEVSFVGRI